MDLSNVFKSTPAEQEELLDIIPFEEPPIEQINEQPRLYTFKEVNDLVLMIMDNSVMHDRLIQAENNIETIFKNI